MRRFTRSGLRRAVGRVRNGPGVTVIVWVPEGAAFVEECLASVRASLGVRPEIVLVPEGRSLQPAVASATGQYLTFLSADDTLRPWGLADLVAALTKGVSPVVVSAREVRRGWRVMPVPPPGSPVDLTLPGKLFRTALVRSTRPPFGSWEHQALAVTSLLRAAGSVAVAPEPVATEHERDVFAPVDRQRRFRADLAAQRLAALGEVLSALPAHDVGDWCAAAVADLLPQLCRDAVGGGPGYFSALQPLAREIVDGLPGGCADDAPVSARLVAWAAAHGSLEHVALVLDHLADNPNGLPVTGHLTELLPEVEVPEAWRRIGRADRRLRSRVLDLVWPDHGPVVLRGNAFVTYDEEPGRPQVFLRDKPLEIRPWADPSADAWAKRAWEDRSGCGFEAELDVRDLSSGSEWPVRVSLAGFEDTHRVRLLPPEDPAPVTRVDDVALGAKGLLVRGVGSPTRLRLNGSRGTTPWAEARVVGDRFEATLTLVTTLFGARTAPSGGRYLLESQGPRGRVAPTSWSAALLGTPPDLVGERLGIRLLQDGEDAWVMVGSPLSSADRSAFAVQQRINAYAAGAHPTAHGTVLLESFQGRVMADNPAAIGRELAHRDPGLDLVWVVDDPGVNVPEGTRAAPRRTQAWFDALARAQIYVGNAAAPTWFHKSDGQIHLQTWHGTPLKRIGEDRGPGDFNTWRHRRHLAGQAARWDAMISPSPYCSEIFRSAFRFDGPMLEIGYPRNDILLSDRAPQVRAETRQRLGLTDADRVLLYAPTWREYVGFRDSKPLFLDPAQVVAAVPDTVVLVRGHYNATRQPDVFAGRPRIIDVTRYPDIADLYLAADSLVTDYSSVMFDFALTDKPMVLLTPDLDQYRDIERGFYFDIEASAPGPMVTTTDDVVQRLLDTDRYADARALFRDRFCPYDDGHASARVCDRLMELAER